MRYSMRRDTDGHDAVWLTPDHRRSSQGMQTSGTPQAVLTTMLMPLSRYVSATWTSGAGSAATAAGLGSMSIARHEPREEGERRPTVPGKWAAGFAPYQPVPSGVILVT